MKQKEKKQKKTYKKPILKIVEFNVEVGFALSNDGYTTNLEWNTSDLDDGGTPRFTPNDWAAGEGMEEVSYY